MNVTDKLAHAIIYDPGRAPQPTCDRMIALAKRVLELRSQLIATQMGLESTVRTLREVVPG